MSEKDETANEDLKHRPIRSFVLRQGRLTPAQQRAIETNMPRFGVAYKPELLVLDALFGRTESCKILEIGFGMGDSTAAIAATNPHIDYLGIEVHGPGVGNLLRLIEASQLTNLRLVQHDAVEVLNNMIADGALDGVHIFFPDPWHKKRHNKRRLIQPAFISMLCSKLKAGAYIHVATDWQEYAEWVLEVLSAEPLLENTAKDYAPRPDYRPLTKFEKRGLNLGHGVWDLIFIRK
ncbi:MAG: tRNA (guanosine(46)-N7)-methyltransferase TrmB [Betaproteobacteria bacterium HGW-Betaproteobacteria-8]|nr:MAG: tRNA (guanosine(46)-N7)-methyltransferase TrmB [Betaproteobacteria bacterium HGW-Betaproteobacteria-8]